MRTAEEMTAIDSFSSAGPRLLANRNGTTACVLAFSIGAFIQLSMPLTDLYQIPNVRGVFFALIVAIFTFRFLSGEPIKSGSPLIMSYLALSLFWAVGISYSRAPIYGMSKAVLAASYIWALGTVIYNLIDDLRVGKAFLNGLVVGGILLVGITAAEFGNPIELIRSSNRFFRLRLGEEGNPIMLARHLALVLTTIATFVAVRRKWIDLTWSAPIGLLTCAYLVATGSKGPLLALLTSLVCAPIFLVKKTMTRLIMIVVLVAISFTGGLVLLELLPKAFIQERFIDKIQNLSLRLPGYTAAISAILNADPLALVIGHGTGDFGYLELRHDGRAYPHNLFLEVAYENGVVGLAILLTALSIPLLATMRAAKYPLYMAHKALLAGLAASYIASVINAQFSGDLGANLLIGMFGAATVSITRLEAKTDFGTA